MTDSTIVETDEKREQVAIHSWLDANGEETKDIHVASGYRRKDKNTGELFEYIAAGAAGKPATMLELFGAKTKATNEASQVRQAERRGEEVEGSETDNVIAIFEQIAEGVWREIREGGGVAKVDRDALAQALFECNPKANEGKGLAAIRERLDSDVKWFRKVRKAEDVTKVYNAKVGKAAPKKVAASDL